MHAIKVNVYSHVYTQYIPLDNINIKKLETHTIQSNLQFIYQAISNQRHDSWDAEWENSLETELVNVVSYIVIFTHQNI